MPFIEQLLYGHDHLSAASGRRELARSAGMGAEVSQEIAALCDAWGNPPELGLLQPALLSHPLRSVMPSVRGRLFAVIRLSAGENLLFHAVVVADAVYSAYGRNPFALAAAVPFCDRWNGQHGLDRVEVDPDVQATLVGPPPNPDDVGLIDEAVLQFILTGRLQLPLEQVVRQSDRALALIIACLPDKARKELHFASFTTSKANAYQVAAVETEGAMFAGWQRLMMARLDTGVTDSQQEYKTQIARHLGLGDLAGIARVSSRHNLAAESKSKPLVATRQAPEPPAPVRRPAPAAAPAATAPPAAGVRGPGLRPMAATIGNPLRNRAMPDHGLDPAAGPARTVRPKLTGRRGGVAFSHGRRSGNRLFRTVTVVVLMFVAGWVATMWLEGRTLTESLSWAGLPGMDGQSRQIKHAGTLLEVVDVGSSYRGALKHVGGTAFGLNPAGDKGREKALGRLRAEAANPLLEQVDLLVKMSTEGIQQSGRPDREVVRLEAMADQAQVIEKELARLELAWYSLTTGTNWRDLPDLTDAAVEARRDSLNRVESGSLADVRLGLAAEAAWSELAAARGHIKAMADVVRLFRAEAWSPAWEQQLARAAEKISPNAGQVTRAYRNSAFALLRLKRAERETDSRDLPFGADCNATAWPSASVRAVLPLLRREAGRFADQNAPTLLAATLALYSDLEAPERTMAGLASSPRDWQLLQENSAVRFDPEVYRDCLTRLRYEAAWAWAADRQEAGGYPGHLFAPEAQDKVAAFARYRAEVAEAGQWREIAGTVGDPFLSRWAEHQAGRLVAQAFGRSAAFESAWNQCREQTIALQSLVASGRDWSGEWRLLQTTTRALAADFTDVAQQDPAQASRFTYLAELRRALAAQHPLAVMRATVRLDPAALTAPTEIQLELRTPVRGGVWTSQPFLAGPGAPAGSGWVGTTALAWDIPLAATHELTGRVVAAGDQMPLLEISYGSLSDGAGPVALTRQTGGPGGSLSFRVDLEAYWGGLVLPDPGLVF